MGILVASCWFGSVLNVYAAINEQSCFSAASTNNPTTATRFLIDHDHAAVAIGGLFSSTDDPDTANQAWVPYIALGEAFFPSGITWQAGLAYCYQRYSLRLGYEGKFDIPSDAGEEEFPVIHTGYLMNEFLIGPVLLTFMLKYGETWEHYRSADAARSDPQTPYFKTKFNAIESGILLNALIVETKTFISGLAGYVVPAYIEEVELWTVNSFLTLDSTFLPKTWSEGKFLVSLIHSYSSDTEQILAIKNMFFLGPFPAVSAMRFYEWPTSGALAGAFALGYRFFPLSSLKSSNKPQVSWAGGFYLAPYIHYGWGVDKAKPLDEIVSAVTFSLHIGYKLPGMNASISSSVGWNNRLGFVITVISNF